MSATPLVRRLNPAEFEARAMQWLIHREAEHNLLIGILPTLISGQHPYTEPLYLAAIESHGQIIGCAFRTPPFHLGVTQIPAAAHEALVADVAKAFPTLPGVIGPGATARSVANAWTSMYVGRTRPATQLGIYELERVKFPLHPPAGALRVAEPADAGLLYAWGQAFVEDTGIPAHDIRGLTDQLVAEGGMMLWEHDGETCCMTAVNGATPNGIRVSYVYTPPARRGRGYASTLVAHVSQAQLDAGRRFCFLYTDLTNPTSNRIYRNLGYRQVAESVEVRIEK